MCTPELLFASSLFIAAGSGAMQYVGQRQQAQAQNQMAEQNAKSAQASYRLQQAQLQDQLLKQRAQVEQQDVSQTIDAARVQASARVSAAESGLSGVSLDSILMQTDRERAMQSAVNKRNVTTLQQESYNKDASAYFEMQNRVNSVPGGVFPNIGATVLGVAGAGLNAYGSYIYKK